jgi:hypothetical protein
VAELGQHLGLTNGDFAAFDRMRDRVPAEPMELD